MNLLTSIPAKLPTPFQQRCIDLLRAAPNGGSLTVEELACKLGTSRVAITSAMYSLERQGKARSYRQGRDRWAALCFYLLP